MNVRKGTTPIDSDGVASQPQPSVPSDQLDPRTTAEPKLFGWQRFSLETIVAG